jgi:hypothetical protein
MERDEYAAQYHSHVLAILQSDQEYFKHVVAVHLSWGSEPLSETSRA